jgi:uncharacterized protein YndB with AHSA1/START domain
MRTVRVERTIAAPIERVFDLLTDHAGYSRFRGITGSELLREGKPAPNGLGALRRVDVSLLHFEEEITAFEPPIRMDYLIVKVNLPFEHEGGSIRLQQIPEGTHVDWTSTFRITLPLIGGPAAAVFGVRLRSGFSRVLEDVDRMLTEG